MNKPIAFLSLLLIAVLVTAQTPNRMSYQSVIRDTDNNLVANQEVGMQISILQGAADGTAVYVERHFPETNANGLVSLEIGGGTIVSGSFEEIDWGADMYFIKTETDLQGGASYTIAGVSQVLSVPYALHAKTAETATEGLEETDPVFMASPAAGIEAMHLDNWDKAFSWGDHEGLYRPEDWTPDWEDMPGGNHPGDMRYWDGTSWLSIEPGEQGQTLTWCNGVPQWGPCLDNDLYDLVLHVDPDQGGTSTGGGAYAEDTQVNIVASANPGWVFTGWTGDTDYLDNVASSNATVTMPGKSISLTANFEQDDGAMVLVFDTRLADGTTIALPLMGTVAVTVDWGDGNQSEVTSPGLIEHTYDDEGEYTVGITGQLQWFGSNASYDHAEKLIKVTSFGNLEMTSLSGAFWGAENLTQVPDNLPVSVTSLSNMFREASAFNQDIGEWDVGNVTNMGSMFNIASAFNQDIGGWDVGSVTNMRFMFDLASAFNQDIGGWDVSNVTDMMSMFQHAESFNQNIGGWDVNKVTNMQNMFFRASAFNQDIGEWDVSKVTTMRSMFNQASAFNQNIGMWDVSSVTDMDFMFNQAIAFNQDLSGWCVTNIPSEPDNFDTGALAWDLPRPVWGTCPVRYLLSLEVVPENVGEVSGGGYYEPGKAIDISATANAGWQFVNWTGDTGYAGDLTSATTTVTMPDYNILLTANFHEEEVPEGTVTDIEGNVYRTVIIGNQEWMAENLRVTRYNNEEAIPTDLSDEDWTTTTEGAYAIFDHNHEDADGIDSPETMAEGYGKLYNWYAVDDVRGLCPEGWIVPSGDDWTQLVDYVVSQEYPNEADNPDGAGNALKSCQQVDSPLGDDCDTSEHPRWDFDSTHSGFDEVGFSALPGGRRWDNGDFNRLGNRGAWWASNQGSGAIRLLRMMESGVGNLHHYVGNKRMGLSVRCIRD